MGERVTVEGTVENVIFHNEENGYTVLLLTVEGEEEPVTVVGCIPCAAAGEGMTVTGVWSVHPVHGSQLTAESVERRMPEREEDMIAYLSSGILMLVLGASLLLHTEGSLSFFCTVLGILILTDGLFKVQIAVEARTFGIPQWPLLLAAAFVTACFGCVLIFRPSLQVQLMGRLLGVSLILDAILNTITMLTTVKIIRSQRSAEKEVPCV